MGGPRLGKSDTVAQQGEVRKKKKIGRRDSKKKKQKNFPNIGPIRDGRVPAGMKNLRGLRTEKKRTWVKSNPGKVAWFARRGGIVARGKGLRRASVP